MKNATVYLHPTATHSQATLAAIQAATGRVALFEGHRFARLVAFNPKKAVRTHAIDHAPWGGDAA